MVTTATVLALTVLTLAAFAALGVWGTRGRVDSVEDLITARASTRGWPLTATLVSSVMGVWILFSPVEAGAAFGGVSAAIGYAVGEAIPMLAYARLGPRIRRLIPEGHSLTEYAYARYGPRLYAFVLVVSLFYMFIFLASELTAITNAHQLVADVPRWQTAALVGGFVLLYTGYGGLRASILTDAVQAVVVVPLLLVAFVAAVLAVGGPGAAYEGVVAVDPSLADPTFLVGLQFGVWVSVAILGAELVNQLWWQRIYAAADASDLPRAFGVAAALNFAVMLVAGLFGVVAVGQVDLVVDPASPGYNASNALFLLLSEAFPAWLVLAVVLLALLLVMSTADSLFNAMASVVTADLPRVVATDDRTLRLAARALTVVVALAAVLVALRARSVLRLFLLADLLGAAVAGPLLYGLYSERATEWGTLAASVAGLAVGVVYFPNPLVRGALATVAGGALPAPSFTIAFIGAAGVSTGLALLAARVAPGRFDLGRLAREIRALDEVTRADGGSPAVGAEGLASGRHDADGAVGDRHDADGAVGDRHDADGAARDRTGTGAATADRAGTARDAGAGDDGRGRP